MPSTNAVPAICLLSLFTSFSGPCWLRLRPTVKPSIVWSPITANTLLGEAIPSTSLNQPMALLAALVMVSFTSVSLPVIPLTRPSIVISPRLLNLAGNPVKNVMTSLKLFTISPSGDHEKTVFMVSHIPESTALMGSGKPLNRLVTAITPLSTNEVIVCQNPTIHALTVSQ